MEAARFALARIVTIMPDCLILLNAQSTKSASKSLVGSELCTPVVCIFLPRLSLNCKVQGHGIFL